MEVIKQQMAKENPAPPPVAPHAPLHGVNQPSNLLTSQNNNNNNNSINKGPRPAAGILRHPNLAAPS